MILAPLFATIHGQYILFRRFRYLSFILQHRRRIFSVRKAGKAKVLVVISNMAMWRLEGVVRLLKQDSRFQVTLAVCPFKTFAPEDKKANVEAIVSYLRSLKWEYVYLDEDDRMSEFMRTLDPDLVFYQQLYSGIYGSGLNCEDNLDRLITYVPYALPTTAGDWSYNSRYFNLAWRIYYPTEIHLQYARRHSYNHARNMFVVGDSHASAFLNGSHAYPWKGTGDKKRVIWAPHFSIRDEGHLHRTGFLWLHQAMWDIAVQFKDRIEFVFKPHPRLLTELYRHPDWGKDKTDTYYERWKNGDNTQLETEAYVDLFCTSDAMIHDCGSFSAEYHYTGKPVLFVSKDFADVYRGIDDFGTLCMDLHYHAQSVEEIRAFIQDVVLDGKDPRKEERDAFRKKYLIPAEGSSFEQNVYHSLTKDLFKD